jgi:ribonuclease III
MVSHPDPQELLNRLMRDLGHEFADKKLLVQALTHRSFVNESALPDVADNERLEFLGDAVIALIVSSELMTRQPAAREGPLSRVRASMVDEPALARLARDLELGEALRLGRGEDLSGGRSRSSLLADAFEAVIGAVYLDGGFERARQVLVPRLRFPEGDAVPGDPKTELQERLQAERHVTPTYRVAAEDGPDHNKTFVVELLIDGQVMGQAQGRTKKEAERAAAASFLTALGPPEPMPSTDPPPEAAPPSTEEPS